MNSAALVIAAFHLIAVIRLGVAHINRGGITQ